MNLEGASDDVVSILKQILKWMDEHEDALPSQYTPQGNFLYKAFSRIRLQQSDQNTKEQNDLLEEIIRRKIDPRSLESIKQIQAWSARHDGREPIRIKTDAFQSLLAQKLRRLSLLEPTPPRLQKLLNDFRHKVQATPTKARSRGAKQRDRTRAASTLLQLLEEEHKDWCGLHYPLQDGS